MRLLCALFAACLILSAGLAAPAGQPPGLFDQLRALPEGSRHDIRALSDTSIGLAYSLKDSPAIEYRTYDLRGRQVSGFTVPVDPTEADKGDIRFLAESNGSVHLFWSRHTKESLTEIYGAVADPAGKWVVEPKKIWEGTCPKTPWFLMNETAKRVVVIAPPYLATSSDGIGIWTPGKQILLSMSHEQRWIKELDWNGFEENVESMTMDNAGRVHVLSGQLIRIMYLIGTPREELVYMVCTYPDNLGLGRPWRIAEYDAGTAKDGRVRIGGGGKVEFFYLSSELPDDSDEPGWTLRQLTARDKDTASTPAQPLLIPNGDEFILIDSAGKRIRIAEPKPPQPVEPVVRLVNLPANIPQGADAKPGIWDRMAFSMDGKLLAASSSAGCEARVWEFISGKLLGKLKFGGRNGRVLGFSPDSKSLTTLERRADGPVVVFWDVGTFRPSRCVLATDRSIKACDVSPDGGLLVTVDGKYRVRLWDLRTLRSIRTLGEYGPGRYHASSAVFCSGGKQVAVSTGRKIRMHSVPGGKVVQEVRDGFDAADRLMFDGDSKTMAAVNSTGYVWNLSTGLMSSEISLPRWEDVRSDLSPDGKLVAASWDPKTVDLLGTELGRRFYTIRAPAKVAGALRFSPDGKSIAASLDNRELGVWSVSTGELLADLTPDSAVKD